MGVHHITKLSLVLDVPANAPGVLSQPLTHRASSIGPYLQGVIMDQIQSAYADHLHQLNFNPYSQYCCKDESNKHLIWNVSALTDEAAEQIIEPLRKMDLIELKSIGVSLPIASKSTYTINVETLLKSIYDDGGTKADVRFLTPTAFKSRKTYVFMPTSRLLFQNLLMHYEQVYGNGDDVEEETLSYVEQHAKIVSYNLRSHYFANAAGKGKRIPAFIGSATFRFDGSPAMAGLARMLLKFAEYAGVGIKTAMGMGGVECTLEANTGIPAIGDGID